MKKLSVIFLTALICCLLMSACVDKQNTAVVPEQKTEEDSETLRQSSYFSFLGDEPNTMDPQCTSEHYNVPLNVFDRLVEVKTVDGENQLVPSLLSPGVFRMMGLRIHSRSGKA